MEPTVLFWMVKDEARKPVYNEAVRDQLKANGWEVEGFEDEPAPARRGRKAKVEE